MERKPSILAKPKVAAAVLIGLLAAGIAVAIANSGPDDSNATSSPASSSADVVPVAYDAVLRTSAVLWESQTSAVAAQKFAAAHPQATSLPLGLQRAIVCQLPAGTQVHVQPFDSWTHPGTPSRFGEVTTQRPYHCDGVARIAP
ncbi:MAG: hypothetical protein ACRET2_07625 [Steroidobacteraceae bacterium]